MKKLFLPLCVLLLNGCISQSQSFTDLSNKVSSCQLKNGIRKNGADRFNEVRLKLSSLNNLHFFDSATPIHLLETYDLESGTIYGFIWSKKDRLSYKYYQDKFSFNEDLRFSEHMIKLVETWDINAIKKEEELNAHSLPNSFIYATTVTKGNNKNVNVECIMFKEFFKLGRD